MALRDARPIHLEPVTAENWQAVAALGIGEDQRRFIIEPSVAHALAEVQFYPSFRPFAVLTGDTVVGFLIFGRSPEDSRRCWLPLILIDRRYQRRGYGRAAMKAAIARARLEFPECVALGLSYKPENLAAARLYHGLGFEVRGPNERGETEAWLMLNPGSSEEVAERQKQARMVFIYGPPGVGKLTVARELARLTGFRLVHNHLTVNVVTPLFERGSESWTRLLVGMRRQVFGEAARQGLDFIVTAAPHGTPESIELNRYQLESVWAAGARVLFVQLTCSREENLRRVQNAERIEQDKLTDPNVLTQMLDSVYLSGRLPFEPCLTIDTTALAPSQVAARIAQHYALNPAR